MNFYVPLQNQIIISTEYVTKLRPISPICCQNGALSLFSSIFYGEKLERIVFFVIFAHRKSKATARETHRHKLRVTHELMKPKHFFRQLVLSLVLSSAGVSPVFAAWEYERNGLEDEGGGTYNFRIENQYGDPWSPFVIDLQHLPDGISDVRADEPDVDAWYTLQGFRLSGCPESPGIYIHNGQKVAIGKKHVDQQ